MDTVCMSMIPVGVTNTTAGMLLALCYVVLVANTGMLLLYTSDTPWYGNGWGYSTIT